MIVGLTHSPPPIKFHLLFRVSPLAIRVSSSLPGRSLVDLLFWLAVACCVVAQVAIARSTLGIRARVNDQYPGVPQPRRAIEITWTVLPALGLALVLGMTWRAIHQPAVADRPPVVIQYTPSVP